MSQSAQADTQKSSATVLIPSMLTNSFRNILDAFGAEIIRICAHGSVETTNATAVDELRQYAVTREQQTQHRLLIDYEQLRGSDGPANPLTPDARDKILAEVEAVLDADTLTVKPDLAVTSVTIRTRNEALQEITPAQSPEFDLTFVADPAETPIRERTKRANATRGLYNELGFNITNLNLRSVVETETKYHQQSDGRYFSWGGPDDIRPRSPKRLAIRINEEILPEEYGMLKPYRVTDDRVLEIPEEELDEGDTKHTTAKAAGGDNA
jgi:hypothetical protein